ncbi:MAG TPA: hypothetical protein VI168_10595 [Croceibacterium sp.]
MSILERFAAFAEGLAPEQRGAVEEFLVSIMDSHAPEFALTAEDLAEVERRGNDPAPERIDEAAFRAKLQSHAR